MTKLHDEECPRCNWTLPVKEILDRFHKGIGVFTYLTGHKELTIECPVCNLTSWCFTTRPDKGTNGN